MNIALYLWLPLYLNDSLGYTSFESGLLSTLFDIGGVAGGPIIGFLSDQDGRTLSWISKASLMSSLAFILWSFCLCPRKWKPFEAPKIWSGSDKNIKNHHNVLESVNETLQKHYKPLRNVRNSKYLKP